MPRRIIDIYHGDRGIDLALWKAKHDLWAVIPKCGGSEDSYWNRFEETTWPEQAREVQTLGMHLGAFYYSDALTAADALADAKHCVNECLRGIRPDLPIYLDIEERSQLNLPKERLTEVVKVWCDYVSAAGYQAGVYSGYEGFSKIEASAIAPYSRWLACWQESWPTWALDYDLWQEGAIDYAGNTYHNDGDVDLAGHIDLDWASDAFVKRYDGGGKVPEKWATTIETCKDPADWAYCTCKIYSCGYSQPKRARLTIELLKAGTAETDCSFGVGFWLYMGGYIDENPEFYTAIERDWLKAHGFYEIDANAGFVKMQRNDVLWKPGHTALYIGDGLQAEALRDENHQNGYEGTIPGDQDGGETVVRSLTYDWDYILRKIDPPEPEPEPEQEEGTRMAPFFVRFDGDSTEHLFNPWAGTLRAIKNADEKKSIIWVYQKAGVEIDPKAVDYGSKDSPWGARANDALSRGANFVGFERFEKHPSYRAIIREELANALNKGVLVEALVEALIKVLGEDKFLEVLSAAIERCI